MFFFFVSLFLFIMKQERREIVLKMVIWRSMTLYAKMRLYLFGFVLCICALLRSLVFIAWLIRGTGILL